MRVVYVIKLLSLLGIYLFEQKKKKDSFAIPIYTFLSASVTVKNIYFLTVFVVLTFNKVVTSLQI